MKNVSDKSCRENQKAYFTLIFFNTVGQATGDNTALAYCVLET